MVMLLEHIGWTEAAEVIRQAYVRTIAEGIVTYDFARLKPGSKEVSTSAFGDALCDRLGRKS
jgi:isocitrate dehydrogenase